MYTTTQSMQNQNGLNNSSVFQLQPLVNWDIKVKFYIPSMDIHIQWLSVILVIWVLRRLLILYVVENALSQSAIAVGNVRQIWANLQKFGTQLTT